MGVNRGSLFLDASFVGETLSRAGSAAYWVDSYGQNTVHFEEEVRRAHKKLTEVIASFDNPQPEAAPLIEIETEPFSEIF